MNNNMFGNRQCQKNTFNNCRNNSFGIVSDTCGSGKSRVQDALICQSIEDNECSICVFQAPRLCLIEQQEDNFYEFQQKNYPNIEFDAFEISSANREKSDENDNYKHDRIDSSTSVNDIVKLIINHINNKVSLVIFLCNASVEKLYNAINIVKSEYKDFKIDEYIVDEGHYNTNNMAKNEGN